MQAFIVLSLCAAAVTAQFLGSGGRGSQASASAQSFGGGDNYPVGGGLGGYPIGGGGFAGGYPNKGNYVSGYPRGGFIGGGGYGGRPHGIKGGFIPGGYSGGGYYGR